VHATTGTEVASTWLKLAGLGAIIAIGHPFESAEAVHAPRLHDRCRHGLGCGRNGLPSQPERLFLPLDSVIDVGQS
jgi:hypothetical protein